MEAAIEKYSKQLTYTCRVLTELGRRNCAQGRKRLKRLQRGRNTSKSFSLDRIVRMLRWPKKLMKKRSNFCFGPLGFGQLYVTPWLTDCDNNHNPVHGPEYFLSETTIMTTRSCPVIPACLPNHPNVMAPLSARPGLFGASSKVFDLNPKLRLSSCFILLL